MLRNEGGGVLTQRGKRKRGRCTQTPRYSMHRGLPQRLKRDRGKNVTSRKRKSLGEGNLQSAGKRSDDNNDRRGDGKNLFGRREGAKEEAVTTTNRERLGSRKD